MRFGLVGLGLNALAFGAYLFLVDVISFDPRISITVVQVVFLPISYVAQRSLTFRSVSYSGVGAVVYVLAYFGSIAFQVMNIHLFHTVMQFPHQVVAAVGLVLSAGGFFWFSGSLCSPKKSLVSRYLTCTAVRSYKLAMDCEQH